MEKLITGDDVMLKRLEVSLYLKGLPGNCDSKGKRDSGAR